MRIYADFPAVVGAGANNDKNETMKMDVLKSLETWYASQCDGDWEHTYGIKIYTLDNPGWRIEIDLIDTDITIASTPYKRMETSENDWYGYQITDSKFIGAGDPGKLGTLIKIFMETCVSSSSKTKN